MNLIYAKFDADLINISKVTSRKTKWPWFFWPTRDGSNCVAFVAFDDPSVTLKVVPSTLTSDAVCVY